MKLYVFAGRPCSGKTTFAYQFSKRNSVDVMFLDVFAHEEIQKSTIKTPELYKWKTKDMTEILQDDPDILFDDYLRFYDELFPLFIKEIRRSNLEELVIESAMLLPKYLDVLKEEFDLKVVFLKTSNDFVDRAYRKRDYAIEMSKSEKGKIALNNLLKRDILFSNMIYDEAKKHNYDIITINDENEFEGKFYKIEKNFLKK